MLCNIDLRVSVILDLVSQIELCFKNEKPRKGNKKQIGNGYFFVVFCVQAN